MENKCTVTLVPEFKGANIAKVVKLAAEIQRLTCELQEEIAKSEVLLTPPLKGDHTDSD